MYTNMKSYSGRVRGARGVLSFFILSLLAFSLPGLAPEAVAAELNISIEKTSAREGDPPGNARRHFFVTITASEAPGVTDTGKERFFGFDYKIRGTASDKDFSFFNNSPAGNIIRGSKTTFRSVLAIKEDTEKEEDETIIISIERDAIHNFGSDLYPSSLRIGNNSSVTFTIKDDD